MRPGPLANSTPPACNAKEHVAQSSIAATPIHNRSTSCQGNESRAKRLAKNAVITTTSAAAKPVCISRTSLRRRAESMADNAIGDTTSELPAKMPIRKHNTISG